MSAHRHLASPFGSPARIKRVTLALFVGLLAIGFAAAATIETDEPGEPVERHLSDDQTFQLWSQDPSHYDSERGDRLEVRQVVSEDLDTVKLKNVVPPIRF